MTVEKAIIDAATAYLRWPDSMLADETAMARLSRELEAGQSLLADLLTLPEGFAWEDRPQETDLLLNYALYAESSATDEFEGNYAHVIQRLRSNHLMEALSDDD